MNYGTTIIQLWSPTKETARLNDPSRPCAQCTPSLSFSLGDECRSAGESFEHRCFDITFDSEDLFYAHHENPRTACLVAPSKFRPPTPNSTLVPLDSRLDSGLVG